MEYFILNNGIRLPAVGFGSYNPKGQDYYEIASRAIDAGYRLFDTASLYGTEKQLGKALSQSGLRREEYIVQSKLWIDEMGYDNALRAFERSRERLRLDYLDIYFIHWPRHYELYGEIPGHSEVCQKELPYDKSIDWEEQLIGTYRAMEELYEKKLIRGIGLSNFLPQHLMKILGECRVKPVVDQLELHIGYDQPTAAGYCRKNGILCEAWSPFARGKLFNDGFIGSVAQKYGVSAGQLALRYLYQSGILCLPKASSPESMKQNLDIFSFSISDEDFYTLACMVPAFWCTEHPDFRLPAKTSDKSV